MLNQLEETSMEVVTLINGKVVSWDEFSKWSSRRQKMSLNFHLVDKEARQEIAKKSWATRRESLANGAVHKEHKGESHFQSRRVLTPRGEFCSLTEAGRVYGVRYATIKNWIDNGKNGFAFLSPKRETIRADEERAISGREKRSARAVLTPGGRFETITAAAAHYDVSRNVLLNWLNSEAKKDFRFETELSDEQRRNRKKIKTPGGIFKGIQSAADFHGVSRQAIYQRLSSKNFPGYEYVKE